MDRPFDGAIEDFEGNHRQKKKQVPADSHKYQRNRYLVSWVPFGVASQVVAGASGDALELLCRAMEAKYKES